MQFDNLILKFLDSPLNVLAVCVALLVVVLVALNAKHSLYVMKSLRRNLLRTILTGVATMVLVFVVTVVWTILGFLEQVTEDKSKDFKAIITEKWQIPSQMPPSYEAGLAAEAVSLPAHGGGWDKILITATFVSSPTRRSAPWKRSCFSSAWNQRRC